MYTPLKIGIGLVLVPKLKRSAWLKKELESAGPTYIKLGQFVANRRDVFGPEISDGLRALQDKVAPIPWETLEPHVPKGFFKDIDTEPVATASIAQVHRATLKSTGRTVALKIMKPGVRQSVQRDINGLRLFGIKGQWVDEFERGMNAEFDFSREVRNLQTFGSMYAYSSDVIVPRVYPEYCTDSLITMDYEPSDRPTSPPDLVRLFINQVLYEDHVHGDLHGGNIGRRGNSLVLYDFGNVIDTTPMYRRSMRDFVYALQMKDDKGLVKAMKALGMRIVNENTTSAFVDRFFKYIDTLDIAAFTFDPDEVQEKIPIELDSTTIAILRSYSLLEGYCKRTDPDFSYSGVLTETLETLYLDIDYALDRAQRDIKIFMGM